MFETIDDCTRDDGARDARRLRAGLARQADQVPHVRAGRQLDRRARPHDRRQAQGPARPAGRRREQAGRRRHGRDRPRSRKSAPDGYTMVLAFNGPLAFAPLLQKLPYDVAEGPGAGDHHVEPAERARRQRDAAGAIRSRSSSPTPRRIPASSTTRRSATAARRISTWSSSRAIAGFDAVHVPFNGSPPAVKATVQDETQMMFAVMQPLQAQIQAGKLRAIAVTTGKRFPLLPDLPTIAESGYPGFEALAWNGVLVAAGTPRPIIARLNAEMNAVLKEPDVATEDAWLRIRPDRRHAGGIRRIDQRRSDAMGAGDQESRPEGRLA